MKNRGFTLIELLAVIIILAIIALIATPIILNIIDDAKEESNEISIDNYAKAVENAVAKYQLNNTEGISGKFTTTEGKTLTLEGTPTKQLKVEYDGAPVVCETTIILKNGGVYLKQCTVGGVAIDYVYGANVCSIEKTDENKYSIGDIVTCGTEQFYVIEDEDEDTTEGISMLSMYNLNVGTNAYTQGTLGIQNENVFGLKNGYPSYGNVAFSTSEYWTSSVSSYPAYVYNESSDLYQYVSAYETYLIENGVNSASATLISHEQLENLDCSLSDVSCSSAQPWVYSTTYWTGSSSGYGLVRVVRSNGAFAGENVPGFNFYPGVRPVITISTSDIG